MKHDDKLSMKKLEIISDHLQKASSLSCNHLSICPQIDPDGGGIHTILKSTCLIATSKSNEKIVESSIKQGDEIMSCPAVAIALDEPLRSLRCAYCVRPLYFHKAQTNNRSSGLCSKCFVVSICEECKAQGVDIWHEGSGECLALSCLVSAHCKIFGNHGSNDEQDEEREKQKKEKFRISQITVSEEMANLVDSSYIITIRIMIRRWNDCERLKKSPLPPIQWTLFDQLYVQDIGDSENSTTTIDEKKTYNAAITKLCQIMREKFVWNKDDEHGNMTNWISKHEFDVVLGKVIGCGHAITDVTVSLGCQSLGRAIFLEHSFYNHCCTPNAFISCDIPSEKLESASMKSRGYHQCALISRLHCARKNICNGEQITISYIPTSGLDRIERRQRLLESYGFICNCNACDFDTKVGDISWGRKLEDHICLPEGSDVEILRQIQFSSNEELLQIRQRKLQNSIEGSNIMSTSSIDGDDSDIMLELHNCIATIKMNQRGIKNQGIPKSHEVSIEAHRLLALAYSLAGEVNLAIEQYKIFLDAVLAVKELYDPVALASSLLAYAHDLATSQKDEEYRIKLSLAYDYAKSALGVHHSFVRNIEKQMQKSASTQDRNMKRQKRK